MRDFYFNQQSVKTDSVNSTIMVPQINIPSSININTQLSIPRPRIKLIDPDTVKQVNKPRIYRPAPPPPPAELSHKDSIEMNLINGDSLYTNWNFSTDLALTLSHDDFSAIGDSMLISDLKHSNDSVTNDTVAKSEPLSNKSHTTNQTKQLLTNEYVEKPQLQQDWFIGLIATMILITGLVRMNWYRYLKDVMLTIFFPSFTSKLSRSNVSNFLPSFILGALFYFNSTIFTYQILTHYHRPIAGINGPLMLPVILSFLFILFTAKIITYRIVGKIFDTSNSITHYLSSASASSKAFGVLVLPIIVFLPFTEPNIQEILIKTGIGLFTTLYLIQLGHGIRTNFSNLLSAYYIILYLCALEILPLAILYKVLFK